MSNRDKDMPAKVTVQGQLLDDSTTSPSTYRVYRYHVNILKPAQALKQDYERELRIHHVAAVPSDQTSETDSLSITSEQPQATNLNTSAPARTKTHAVSTTKTPSKIKSLKAKLAALTWPITVPQFKLRTPDLGQIKYLFDRLNKTVAAVADKISGRLAASARRLTLPTVKQLVSRPVFAHNGKRPWGKAGLTLAITLVLTVVLCQWLQKPATINTAEQPAAPPVSEQRFKTSSNYQAVITQNAQGVTITLQGPNHEEVLTTLPPGYHPTVIGNKIVHIVTRGNTLWFIAKRYIKNPYHYPELARLNNIKNPDLIYPGEKVTIQYISRP